MTKDGVSHYLGISTRTVVNLVANGTLRPVKLLNRTWLFDVRDLDRLVDVTKANQQ